MGAEIMDVVTGEWRKPNQQEVCEETDIEGRKPCDLCWVDARDHGIYVWPVKEPEKLNRCLCGRVISSKKCSDCGEPCMEEVCQECRSDLLLCQELDYYGRWGYLDDVTRARLVAKGMT